jgi:hypothetical protein
MGPDPGVTAAPDGATVTAGAALSRTTAYSASTPYISNRFVMTWVTLVRPRARGKRKLSRKVDPGAGVRKVRLNEGRDVSLHGTGEP